MDAAIRLAPDSNQALGIGRFAIDFISGALGPGPSAAVLERTALFHADSVACAASALALQTNAPVLLRAEALDYPDERGATVFASRQKVKAEKAIAANSSAAREWDSNGTNFGFRPELGHTAGEFGHNDFYPVAVAACQEAERSGADALRAMVLIDEIRGRLAEVFSLKSHKIDHVVHGAIASAAAYGALRGATAEQIESAIGMFVAHFTPWRAIRAGKQLSDSKGASAAISSEAAILCMKRSLAGFLGPRDIFRNPESLFRQFEPTSGDSPFELVLSHSGDGFAVMGMHFKLGLYEHQSAGAIQAALDFCRAEPDLLADGLSAIDEIVITAYEPAFGIIGDPAKRNPTTRQSADHSMVFIIARLLAKASAHGVPDSNDEAWMALMLEPADYGRAAIQDTATRAIMEKIRFEHGGEEFDRRYPDGIPTAIAVRAGDRSWESGLVMYPAGHCRNTTADLRRILDRKFELLGGLAVDGDASPLVNRALGVGGLNAEELMGLYDLELAKRDPVD
jgi:2-methylcitrate dehydratase